MSFWGVEVKPKNPVTYPRSKTGKRIRITQATLGAGNSRQKSVLQCSVGRRRPVSLCVLLPGNVESCNFKLEFEEPNDVVFSVIGRRSIHLAGYYLHNDQTSHRHIEPHIAKSNKKNRDDKLEDVMEDVESEKSHQKNEDDGKIVNSFIPNTELPIPAPSLVACRGDVLYANNTHVDVMVKRQHLQRCEGMENDLPKEALKPEEEALKLSRKPNIKMSRHPEVKWAEREDKVYLTVLLPDAKNPKVSVDPNGIFTFSAIAGMEDNLYELKLALLDKVEVSKIKIGVRDIFCVLEKAGKKWWKKLLRGDEKTPHYVKVDWDKWVDEEDHETGGAGHGFGLGGMDFSKFGDRQRWPWR